MKLMRMNTPETWTWPLTGRLSSLRDEINRLFESPFEEWTRTGELFSGWAPALDLREHKDAFEVKVELPGMKKEDIDVSFENGALSISGERKLDSRFSDATTCRSERFFGRFHRTLALPKPVDAAQIKAAYKDGLLTVDLPKTETARPKQIEVKVG